MDRRRFLKNLAGIVVIGIPLEVLAESTEPTNKTNDNQRQITISGVGDVTLGYHFSDLFAKIEEAEGTEAAYRHPFEKVAAIFLQSDIAVANLEGVLTNSENPVKKEFVFKGEPRYANCLRYGHIAIVNLGNNHFLDYNRTGARDTIQDLTDAGVMYCGGGLNNADASEPRIVERNGVKIAFLGYALVGKSGRATKNAAGTNPYDNESASKQVASAKDDSDIVVVSCHWGIERSYEPTLEQRTAARNLIDSGADIIFGHHPHVLQPVEKYKGGVIFYSLGNFVFGGNRNPEDKDSVIAQAMCSNGKILDIMLVPVRTHPQHGVFQPYIPSNTTGIEAKIMEMSPAIRKENFYTGKELANL